MRFGNFQLNCLFLSGNLANGVTVRRVSLFVLKSQQFLNSHCIQQIDMVIQFAANHRGGYWIELCNLNNGESDNCFTRLTVVRADREIRPGNMVCSGGDHQNGPTNLRVQLPANFRCTRCTLRWTYRTSYPPG